MKTFEIAEIQVSYKPTKHHTPEVRSTWQAYELAKGFFSDVLFYKEAFKVIYLNHANEVLGLQNHALGGVSYCSIDIRQLVAIALKANASGIILLHNHPSGNMQPSSGDLALTRRVVEACHLFNIAVLDHLIIGDDTYYSFADEDLMPTIEEK